MRTLIISLVAFLVVVTIWFFAMDYLNDSIKELIAIDNQINAYIVEENWETAEEAFEEFIEIWDKHESIYHIFLHQGCIMEVNHAISEAKIYIEYKEIAASLGHLSFIKVQLLFLYENELVTLQNIF